MLSVTINRPMPLLPHFWREVWRSGSRLPQTDYDCGRSGQHSGTTNTQRRNPWRRVADPTGRPGYAHRLGRRRGFFNEYRYKRRLFGLQLRTTRQPWNRTPEIRFGSTAAACVRGSRVCRRVRTKGAGNPTLPYTAMVLILRTCCAYHPHHMC